MQSKLLCAVHPDGAGQKQKFRRLIFFKARNGFSGDEGMSILKRYTYTFVIHNTPCVGVVSLIPIRVVNERKTP